MNLLNLNFDADSECTMEVVHSADFLLPSISGYPREVVSGETETTNLVLVATLQPGDGISLPCTSLHNFFYRFTKNSADNTFYWDEHRIRCRGSGTAAASSPGAGVSTGRQQRFVADIMDSTGDKGVYVQVTHPDASDDWDLALTNRRHLAVQTK